MNGLASRSLFIAGAMFVGMLMITAPAQADCLSESECDAIRAELREFRHTVRPIVRQIRRLRSELVALPEDSPERPELLAELRTERRKLRHLRREQIRPTLRRFRQGCKRC